MTRRANRGRDSASTYSRVTKRAGTAAASVVALTWALGGGCTSLPDKSEDDGVSKGTEEPEGPRRDGGDDGPVVVAKPDPCASTPAPSTREKQQASASKVLFNNDFEKPNVPPTASRCNPFLDQDTGINTLYGNDAFQFAQFATVEAVLLRDSNGIYTDPSNKGGRYALGMLSDVQEDKLSLSFANDMPVVNVRLDLSPIAIRNCGPDVPISMSELKVSLYDGAITDEDLESLSREPLDTAVVKSREVKDAWVFNWRTAVVPLDASRATSGTVSVVFDLAKGGYVALDNLSIVASTEEGVVDADTNGVPDDQQCSGAGSATDEDGDLVDASVEQEPEGEAPAGEAPADTVDAGTPRTRRDSGTTTSRNRDAGR